MSDQCRATTMHGQQPIRCQRDKGHDGIHRAEVGHWDGKDWKVLSWQPEAAR